MAGPTRARIAFRCAVAIVLPPAAAIAAAVVTLPSGHGRAAAPPRILHRPADPRPARNSPHGALRLPAELPRRSVDVPILMYHRIAAITPALAPITRALTVSPAEFAAQMDWLRERGFHAITQPQLYDALERGDPLPPKPVMITFDDGYRDVLWNAAPVLARLDMPSTAYVITGRVSGPDPSFLTWQELRRLETFGVEIGSHTVHHVEIPLLSDRQALAELEDSRRVLEARLGHPVQWFAYPGGAETAHAARLVERAGYVLAVTTQPGSIQQASEPLALHRDEIRDTTRISGLASIVTG